jgi:exosortase
LTCVTNLSTDLQIQPRARHASRLARLSDEARRFSFLRIPGLASIAVAVALLWIGQVPLLLKFFADLWSRQQYQFFPVAILAAGYIGYERLRDTPRWELRRGSLWVVAGLLAAAWIVLAGGLAYLRWMAAISAMLTLVAMIWWAGGAKLLRVLLGAMVLLMVIIPPPGRLDDAVGIKLRYWAVHASSRILDLVSVPHIVAGTTIEIPDRRLLVEEACSGINSLMSVIAFGLLYGLWQRRKPWVITLLIAASIGWVMCANVIRITAGAVIVYNWQIDILSGTVHEMLGIALFAATLGLVASFDRCLMLVFGSKATTYGEPTTAAVSNEQPGHARPPSSSKLDFSLWVTAAVAFLVLGALMQVRVGKCWAASRLGDDATFNLPANLAGWERVQGEGTLAGRPETDGRKSQFWLYRIGNLTAGVAMDYPFGGFHDATICYRSAGWDVASLEGLVSSSAAQAPYMEATMSRQPLVRGQLLFSLFDEQSAPAQPDPPLPPNMGRLQYALLLSKRKAEATPTYQVQTLTLGYAQLTEPQRAALRKLFMAARRELAQQVMHQVEGKP